MKNESQASYLERKIASQRTQMNSADFDSSSVLLCVLCDKSPSSIIQAKLSLISQVVALSLLCLISFPSQAQQTPNAKFRLSKIEFAGLQKYTQEQAVAASGLTIGQSVSLTDIDAAGQRLMDSGLFTNLKYRYRTTSGEGIVIFDVVEAKWTTPLFFDNFVWFTDEELLAAIRKQLPSFDGRAPEATAVTDTIRTILEKLVREKSAQAQVEYMPEGDMSGRIFEHVYTVKGVAMPICSLHFTGASAVAESRLVKESKQLFGNNYSRKLVLAFAENSLLPDYKQIGHLRAKFLDARGAPESSADCPVGMTVNVKVDEGLAYAWDKAEWKGNTILSGQELDAALGMKAGEVADGLKIEKGLRKLEEAYGKKGHLMVSLKPAPSFDDAAKRVAYHFIVGEGPEFHMGTLTVTGLSETDTTRVKSWWKLYPKEVYDASYLNEFMKRIREEARGLGYGTKFNKVSENVQPNREKLTVDVTITFEMAKSEP